jgi:hypothetical protein
MMLWSVLSRGIEVSTSHSVRRGNSGVCKGRPSYVDHRSRDGGSVYVAGSDRECTVNFGGIAGLHCLLNCTVVCGEVYVDSRACAEKRQLCNRGCIIKFPAEYTGCNKGWMPTAKGCKCIKPLLPSGVCPR